MGAKDTCPRCARPISDDEGRNLRPLDLDFEARLAEMDARALANTKKGAVVALVVCLLMFMPPISWFGGGLLVILQMIWVRVAIIAPYRKHFGTGRRIVTRWITRLAVATGATLHLPAQAGGLAFGTFIISPIVFAGLCAAAWRYHRWHLQRERAHLPVAWFEKILLWVFALIFVLVVVGVGLAIWGLHSLFGE